jgi:CDP-diacylglycerol--glycerol-3-phosphate 3-phosphatidyltransferase
MTLRTSPLGRFYLAVVDRVLLPPLSLVVKNPDHLTVAGAVLALAVPLGMRVHVWAGLPILLASAVADNLDGLLARRQGRNTRWGAFLDSSMDRIADAGYLAGVWMLFAPGAGFAAAGLLVMAAYTGTVLISYVKARAESLGHACRTGLMDRGLRVVYLLAWMLAAGFFMGSRTVILWLGLAVYLALVWFTVWQRLRYVSRDMARGPEDAGGENPIPDTGGRDMGPQAPNL